MANEGNLKPFVPGQSGNPAGKAPGTKNRSTIVREVLEALRAVPDAIKSTIPDIETKLSYEQIITLAQAERAANGDTNAYKALMDSAYGAPKQEFDANVDMNIIWQEIKTYGTPPQADPGA